MGWNNWNAFHCDVNETLVLETANRMVELGLRDLGYNLISIDDCWSIGRNSSGYLEVNPIKFPSGIPYIADQLHSMGFTLGMYSSAGQDADLWAGWSVDYLKYDNCFNQGQSGTPQISFNRYNAISQALNKTGRPIKYAMCNWGNDDPYDWAYTIANSGRMSGNIYDSLQPTRRPIDSEYVVHFTMWAMNSSPLLIGTNVLTLSATNLAIYSNPAIIALNQDTSAGAAVRKWRYFRAPPELSTTWDVYDLWANRMSEAEAQAIIDGNSTMSYNATATRYNATTMSYADGMTNNATALYGTQNDTLAPSGTFSADVARHSVGVYRLRAQASDSLRKRDEL
ncbi:glycoside hydrolase superfamily [Lophiotrema nucula]|uniref:Alpha-galactosidase n=1 Tax=Lophiotrema nucula TaxID=690887 RepID=A0A6A5ZTW6_9PLEO|nr:glycoside hydrolase superfamily [Lophiotrema nucula]